MGRGIATSNIVGARGKNVRLYEHMSEGYGTDEFYIDHLSRENLQEIADWMIVQPPEIYEKLAYVHRMLEYFLNKM